MAPKTSFALLDHLPIAILLLLCAINASAGADHSFDISPNPSPEASTSLICPNDNPTDCYPALFQPTIHFQKIQPDQSLPPGLHIRLNIQTGEKEARLNVPEESENTSKAVVVIDDVPREVGLGLVADQNPLQLRLQDGPKQEKHARPYTPPRPTAPADPDEVVLYEASVAFLKQELGASGRTSDVLDRDIVDVLETLTELAHSVQWGLAICRDVQLSRTLLASIWTTATNDLEHSNPEVRSATLLLMATAVQNNQDALSALLDLAHDENGYHLPLHATLQLLAHEGGREDDNPNIIARTIFFLSQLCANDKVLAAYLNPDTESFSHLLHLFAASCSKKDAGQGKVRHRIANFVEDHAERGAALLNSGGNRPMGTEIDALLRPWCDAFTIAMQRHEVGMIELLKAKEEVSKALETYTGQGCGSSVDFNGQQEL